MVNNLQILEAKVDQISTKARLDKISLSKILIQDIENPAKLEEKGLIVNGKTKMKYITRTGKEFTSLLIKDDWFGTLKSGINPAKKWTYTKFNTSVKNGFSSNLICNSVEDYHAQIENDQKYLIDEYGIYADFSQATISSIEINKTFKVNADIGQYKRVFELIAWNIPRRKRMNIADDLKKISSEKLETETFRITSKKCTKNQNGKIRKSKQYEELVFYSKSKQIEKIIVLSHEYMRVEIKLFGAAKIKTMLGTNKFYDLTDQIINDFFDGEMEDLIINPYEKWKRDRDKKLIKLLKEQRESDQQNWIVNTLLILANEEIKNGFPMVLDIKEILPLIDKLGIDDSKRRYKIRENFKRQARKRASVFCNDDDQKLQELFDKLQNQEDAIPPRISPRMNQAV